MKVIGSREYRRLRRKARQLHKKGRTKEAAALRLVMKEELQKKKKMARSHDRHSATLLFNCAVAVGDGEILAGLMNGK